MPANIPDRTTTPQPRRRARWVRLLLRASGILAAIPIFCFAAFHAAVAWWPYPAGLDRPPAPAQWLEDRNGLPLAAFVSRDGQWRLPLAEDEFGPHLMNAVIAVEDGRCDDH